jgi:hypothetical protein
MQDLVGLGCATAPGSCQEDLTELCGCWIRTAALLQAKVRRHDSFVNSAYISAYGSRIVFGGFDRIVRMQDTD